MSGVLVVLVLGIVLVVVALVPGGRRAATDGPAGDAVVAARLRGARSRAAACLGLAAVLLVGGAVLGTTVPRLLGLPLAVAPGLAAAAALLGFAALPVGTPASTGPVSASLDRRTAWTYGSRASFALPGVLAVATLAFLGWAAAVAAPDEQGLSREYAVVEPTLGAAAGPFPGGFYGAPLAVVTVLVAAAAHLALRRLASAATLPRRDQAEADRRWRTASTRLVLHLAGAALLAQLGAVVLLAGSAVRRVAASLTAMGSTQGPDGGAGLVLVLAGAALVLLAAVVAALAVREVLALSALRRDRGAVAPAAPVAP